MGPTEPYPARLAVPAAGTVGAVLAEIVVIPSAPLLVPELSGPAADDTVPVRDAVLAAGASLAAAASRWIAIGVADRPDTSARGRVNPRIPDCRQSGDFGAYGVPVPVSLPHPPLPDRIEPPAPLPLSMLLAGWLGAQVSPRPVRIDPVVLDPCCRPEVVRLAVRELSLAERPVSDEPIGVLVIADGANALSPRAPGGGERASAWELQNRIDDAVVGADRETLAALGEAECAAEGVGTRAAWLALAQLLDGRPAWDVDARFRGAPFGVGYTVASFRPAGTGNA